MTPNAPRLALVGRPNSGKSSLYNRLSTGHAEVANYPGITVGLSHAQVKLPDGRDAELVDLPGIYSVDAVLDPDTDEGVAQAFLESSASSQTPLVVVQVVDGNRLELALGLTAELLARRWPLVLVVTQKDVVERQGFALDAAALEAAVGVPVAWVSAMEAGCARTVLQAVERALEAGPRPPTVDVWIPGTLAQRVLTDAAELKPDALARRSQTDRLDGLLLHPVLGPVVFLGLMTAAFAAVFLVADPATSAVEYLTGLLAQGLQNVLGEGVVTRLLVEGVLGGAGTVLGFVPQVALLSAALELMQASGYLARGAFLVDRLLQALGLSGRAFVPLLMGHACAVPAITATRVLRDPFERLTTILVLPLMTCSARIPTYALILAAFFSSSSALVRSGLFVGLYFSGVAAGLVASLVLRRTLVRGRGLPLVLEMPDYRTPSPVVLLRKTGRAAMDFIKDVGGAILVVSTVLWVLLNVPAPGAPPSQDGAPALEHSVAGSIGRAMQPLTEPAGFDWRINVGLVASFGARELMVGTLGVIYGIENAADEPAPLASRLASATNAAGRHTYSRATGLALLAFFVLACQCMSTLVAIRRETRTWKWPAVVLGYTYASAWLASVAVYQGACALGLG